MGRRGENGNYAHYNLRLNLSNPNHLMVHEVLQGLNKETHKSQNSFILESVLRNIGNYSREELMSEKARLEAGREKYVTREELEEAQEQIRADIMKELIVLLCGSNVATRETQQTVQLVDRLEGGGQEAVSVLEEDDTLSSLIAEWS